MTARSGFPTFPTPSPALSSDGSEFGPDRAIDPWIVALQDVTKIYGDQGDAGDRSSGHRRGLLGVTLEVPRGSFVIITGPSGAGKSTLLKLIYGEERPDRGQIWLEGQNVADLRGNRLAYLRRKLGIVFQDYKLMPRRTVQENIEFVLMAQGRPIAEIQRRTIAALNLVGLLDKAGCFPNQLSGGQQQRASIARAIVGTPPLILADEPTGNLDGENADQIIRIFERLNQIGATIILTTHDQRWLARSIPTIWQLHEGQLWPGSPAP